MDFIKVNGRTIAVLNQRNQQEGQQEAQHKGVMWCGGFASTMEGTKASYLAEWAKGAGVDLLRFDYSGCGASSGDFYQGKISFWKAEALAVFEQCAAERTLLIASSMGAWIAWEIAKKYPERIGALLLIAPAPDFTEKLVGRKMKEKLASVGTLPLDDPSGPLSHQLIEDGKRELVLGEKLPLTCPVRILLGLKDEVVSLDHVLEVVEQIDATDLELTLIKNGDHSLSAPEHLTQLTELTQRLYRGLYQGL